MHNAMDFLSRSVDTILPRVLTQGCRDPNIPAYGSFDRNWWHYKIRDFSSIILQQGGYTLWLARDRFRDGEQTQLVKLARASCLFWAQRARLHGAFEEYYPWEDGYPPLAFSTLAVAKLVRQNVCEVAPLEGALATAARKLACRMERSAGNQQVAGLAALAHIHAILPDCVPEATIESVTVATLALQHPDGWYEEYGGPDLGYLSVTMDCLWDLYDLTRDVRFYESARNALGFIARFCWRTHCGAGMHNARNTDYILPYGISRFLDDAAPAPRAQAAQILRLLFGRDKACRHHFLYAVDDRYLCHYVGHSVVRGLLTMQQAEPIGNAESATVSDCDFIRSTGQLIRNSSQDRPYDALLSGHKGGILSIWAGGRYASDFGWILRDRKTEWISHWWSPDWEITQPDADTVTVSGFLVPHKEHVSTPFKHMILRILVLLAGRRLIGALKNILIFKSIVPPRYPFKRTVRFTANGVTIQDSIRNCAGVAPRPAPRTSKRHVASADSFHPEDIELNAGLQLTRVTAHDNQGTFTAETIINVGDS